MPTYVYECDECGETVEITTLGYNSSHAQVHCDIDDTTYCEGTLLRRWRNENPNVVYRAAGFNVIDKRFERKEDDD